MFQGTNDSTAVFFTIIFIIFAGISILIDKIRTKIKKRKLRREALKRKALRK